MKYCSVCDMYYLLPVLSVVSLWCHSIVPDYSIDLKCLCCAIFVTCHKELMPYYSNYFAFFVEFLSVLKEFGNYVNS